jgi:hypothetical protein
MAGGLLAASLWACAPALERGEADKSVAAAPPASPKSYLKVHLGALGAPDVEPAQLSFVLDDETERSYSSQLRLESRAGEPDAVLSFDASGNPREVRAGEPDPTRSVDAFRSRRNVVLTVHVPFGVPLEGATFTLERSVPAYNNLTVRGPLIGEQRVTFWLSVGWIQIVNANREHFALDFTATLTGREASDVHKIRGHVQGPLEIVCQPDSPKPSAGPSRAIAHADQTQSEPHRDLVRGKPLCERLVPMLAAEAKSGTRQLLEPPAWQPAQDRP